MGANVKGLVIKVENAATGIFALKISATKLCAVVPDNSILAVNVRSDPGTLASISN
jgi:hypothetical protein